MFDTSKFFLGKLCPHNHAWENGTSSLRYIKDRGCVECKKAYHQRNKERILAKKSEYHRENIDSRRTYNKHYRALHRERLLEEHRQWRAKNREKRRAYMRRYYKSNRAAKIQYNHSYYQLNAEKLKADSRAWHQANRQRILIRKKLERASNPLKFKQKDRRNYEKHREKILIRAKQWRQTERGRIVRRRLESKREALKKGNHAHRYTQEQVQALRQSFDNTCAYCGSINPETLDHFIPISRGGPDVLGNLLPCCRSCNSSKNRSDPKEWYQQQPSFQKQRWHKILKVLGKTDQNYFVLPLL